MNTQLTGCPTCATCPILTVPLHVSRVFHCWDGLNGLEPVTYRDYVLDPLAIKESVEEGEGGGDGPEGNRSRSPSISSKELSHTVGFEEMDDQQRMAMAGFGTSLPRMSAPLDSEP